MGTAGEKQKRVRIEQQLATPDGQGGQIRSGYALRAVVWAHERPLTGREAIRAEQLAAVLSSVWEIWYRTDISVKDRVLFRGRVMEIEAFTDPTDERDELYLYCSEVQA
jgi:SPP1 family predicted phage head-tail adaptor